MRNGTRRAVLAVSALAAVLVMSGCSSQDDSAPRIAGDEGSGTSKPQDDNAVRKAWVDCMHKQGQTSVTQDKDGNIAVPAAGTGTGGSPAEYDAAAKTCDAKVPGIHQVQDKNKAKFVELARNFVACARKHGYPDLPDPDPKTAILVIPTASFDAAKWDAIQPACSKFPVSYRIGQ
ncbi:hypothetical protein ACFXJ6_31805 [Streptomyces sp. NPDC059218]|uniref:hypothetical protein n=1 Tax=unclassified Streptomyces TaxID=2593676 RepID=UPI0036B956EC